MSNPVSDALAAIGAMCEISGVMREELIKNGFTRREAVALVGDYITATFSPKGNKEED